MSSILESRFFSLPGPDAIQVHALIHRPLASSTVPAPSIFLLPHWGGTARTYTALQSHLAAVQPETTTIAVSYPGTGKSSFPTSDFTIANLTTHILSLFPLLQDDALISPIAGIVLVGHSMGGKVALSLMTHLLSALTAGSSQCPVHVHSLLLLAPAPPGPLVLPAEVRDGQIHAYATTASAAAAIADVLSYNRIPEDTLSQLTADAVGMSPGAKRGWIEVGMGEDVRLALSALAHQNSEKVRELDIRVLVGREDRVETVERVKKETVGTLRALGFEDVSVRIIEGCGHLITIEALKIVGIEISSSLSEK